MANRVPGGLLGGLTPAAFLRRHWQKRPLLIRQAIPGFAGIVDRDAMLRLATRADAVSRLVIRKGGGGRRWERHDGPFLGLEPAMLPRRAWTLLVHGLESLLPGGWELLRRFWFIPAARIDDLMVSYAADGGSVGPHVDAYDVFLLQGPGRRRWQIARGGDRSLDPTAPIKVLARFEPEEEWLLEPGDMLYLPPGVAHHGVAEGPCFTYSIGFLAPSHHELRQAFLGWLARPDADADALIDDPDLRPQADPLLLSDVMVGKVAAVLAGKRPDCAAVADFLGCFLTRPRAHHRFTRPARPLSREAFARRLQGRRGRLALALPTRGLVRRNRLYLNGEAHVAGAGVTDLFRRLVSERGLSLPVRSTGHVLELLHAWYTAGWLVV